MGECNMSSEPESVIEDNAQINALTEFKRLIDIYYWRTAVLIAQNQLSKQYRNSFLGILWSLLQPMTMAAVYTIIMPMIMRFPMQNYILYIITSLTLWNFMYQSLITAGYSLIYQAETLKRCIISSTVFPVADVMKNTYTYFVSFGVMYFMVSLLVVPPHWTIILLPIYFLPVLVTIMALSIAISFAAPYVRDVSEAIAMGLNILVWATPVYYPLSALPEGVRWLFQLNPFYMLLHPIQVLVYEQRIPDFGATFALLWLTTLTVVLSYGIYRKCRTNYVYYL